MKYYRGGAGQWSWAFHRLTGIGVLLFLLTHILDTALVILGPDLYNKIIALYRNPLFGLSEIALFGAVLYHSINGVRICVIDFWPATTRHHRALSYAVFVIFLLSFIPVAIIMLGHIFGGGVAHG